MSHETLQQAFETAKENFSHKNTELTETAGKLLDYLHTDTEALLKDKNNTDITADKAEQLANSAADKVEHFIQGIVNGDAKVDDIEHAEAEANKKLRPLLDKLEGTLLPETSAETERLENSWKATKDSVRAEHTSILNKEVAATTKTIEETSKTAEQTAEKDLGIIERIGFKNFKGTHLGQAFNLKTLKNPEISNMRVVAAYGGAGLAAHTLIRAASSPKADEVTGEPTNKSWGSIALEGGAAATLLAAAGGRAHAHAL
jgi:hypothetical protein